MSELVAGIDPGKKGGWAVFDLSSGELIRAGRLWFDNPEAIYDNLKGCSEILIERAQAAPAQGISTAFEYGRGFGRAETAAIMTGADIYYCGPAWWKGKLAISSDKTKATEKALRLIPGLRQFMGSDGDDGVAEAALIGSVLLSKKLYGELLANNEKRVKPKKKKTSFRL
jgi:hypothetical protein